MLKHGRRFRSAAAILLLLGTFSSGSRTAAAQDAPTVRRLAHNPIIEPSLLPPGDGENINGPSLIRVPDWIEGALGKYYLYFAHHAGTYIRLAYADDLQGPWTVHAPGTLRLDQTVCNDIQETAWADYRHVASPDVHVIDDPRQIRMYFHCPVYIAGPRDAATSYQQVTLVATSQDGLHFAPRSEPLGSSYFRVFRWDGAVYALGMPGILYRSADGLSDFARGPTLFSDAMRHSAVKVEDHELLVFYTVVGQSPERILLSEIDLRGDWLAWRASEPVVVLEPETEWEGALLPLEPSTRGAIMRPVRQLRDPALFEEEGRRYLLYSVAGESGIAIAELLEP